MINKFDSQYIMKKIIFNASMPRSGSELLQVLLHQNPKIYGSATSPLLEYQYAARNNIELAEVKSQDPVLMQHAFISMCAGMAQAYYAPITNRPIVCDKNRGWTHYREWVEQWNPNSKMICMVRDLRATVASMEKIHRQTRHLPNNVDNPATLQNMTVAQRAQHWLTSQPIGLALLRTLDSFQRNEAKHILFVRYEDLCAEPQKTMDSIYEYIGEGKFVHDFVNIKKEVEEDDSHFGPYGRHKVEGPLRPAGRDYIDILGKELCAAIRKEYEWFFEAFNY